MAECIKIIFWIIFGNFLMLNIKSQKSVIDSNKPHYGYFTTFFNKDKLRQVQQDSKKETLKAKHLCIEDDIQNSRLFTCDSRYSSHFACVGSWEGALKRCDKFHMGTVAAAICVEDNTTYVEICEYKNFTSSYLCSPKKLQKSKSSEYNSKLKFMEGFRENIRICKKTNQIMKRICLKHGALVPCVDDTQIEKSGMHFETYSSRRNNSWNVDANLEGSIDIYSPKSGTDDSSFSQSIQQGSFITSNVSNDYISNNKAEDTFSPVTNISKFLKHQKIYSMFSDIPYNSSLNADGSKVKSGLISKRITVPPGFQEFSEFSKQTINDSSLEYNTNKTRFSSNNTGSKYELTRKKKPNNIILLTFKDKSNSSFKYSSTKNQPHQRNILGVSYREDSASNTKILINKKVPSIVVTDSSPEMKATMPMEEKFAIVEAAALDEIKLILEEFESSNEATTVTLDENSKMLSSSAPESRRSTEEFELDKLELIHGEQEPMRTIPEHSEAGHKSQQRTKSQMIRSMEPDDSFQIPLRKPKKTELFYRAPQNPELRPLITKRPRKPQRPKSFFHILKCNDCSIHNDMVIEKNAGDVQPEVEIVTFKN